MRHEAVILPSRKFVFQKNPLTNHLKQKTHIHRVKNVCFIILEAQDVVILKASMTIGRNIFKNSSKVLKRLPYLISSILFFIASPCIIVTDVNCEKLHMLKDIELFTIQVNLAKNNSFHTLLRLVKVHRLHNLKLYETPPHTPHHLTHFA